MGPVGIICEYTPLHLGHEKQIRLIRENLGEDTVIVCAMSGNYVQRGYPALLSKEARAKAALLSGADLVLELPAAYSLRSAEGFAEGGVEILSACGAEKLCFGAEHPDRVLETARLLDSPSFSGVLHGYLDTGLSFPAARAGALRFLGGENLKSPNDILAVEYVRAIDRLHSPMEPMPIYRAGDYHREALESEAPSATALRALALQGESWLDWVPEAARESFRGQTLHDRAYGERAMLLRLRTMSEEEFEALPFGSEGLWRRFMAACSREAALEDILEAAKSKRYTRSRLDRMAMCAFLGISEEKLREKAPYVRILTLNDKGREIVRKAKCRLVPAGTKTEGSYARDEERFEALYGLFAQGEPERPDRLSISRVFYQP